MNWRTHELLHATCLVLSGLALGLILAKILLPDAPSQPAVAPASACPPRQDVDRVCVAWLFRGDLEHARRRVCQSR